MNNYQRAHSPFEDSATQRLRRMGLTTEDGSPERDAMAVFMVTYLGTETETPGIIIDRASGLTAGLPGKVLPYALGILGAGTIATLAVLLFRSRRALRQLQEEPEDESEEEETK